MPRSSMLVQISMMFRSIRRGQPETVPNLKDGNLMQDQTQEGPDGTGVSATRVKGLSELPAANGGAAASQAEPPLHEQVEAALRRYLCDLHGNAPSSLYNLVLAQVEPPLLRVVLEHAGGNRSRAADMLGINRNTLRKKLQHYGLDGGNGTVG